jgi:hypothetical protein
MQWRLMWNLRPSPVDRAPNRLRKSDFTKA